VHLIAQCKYELGMPISRQKSHLTDFNHLNKAHWLTLCGVKVGRVEKKTRRLAVFDLHRFGRVNRVTITQDKLKTTVDMVEYQLVFVIEPLGAKNHYLHVDLLSTKKSLVLLWPLIQIVFLLTVIEDYIYYAR